MYSQLKDCLTNPSYEVWNSTSISHMLIAYSGANGSKTQDLAEILIIDFLDWCKQNNITNLNRCNPHPSSDIGNIGNIYTNMKNYPQIIVQPDQVEQRKKEIFHGDFLDQFTPDEMKS